MFDSYNYVRNNVIKNLKKYKYYACVQDFYKTKDMQTADTIDEVACYYTNNDDVFFDEENSQIKNLKNENGLGYMCTFSLNNKSSRITNSVKCNDFTSFFSEPYASFKAVDYVYTNIENTNYSSIIEDLSYTNKESSIINQDILYLIPFSMILVVLSLWWFRK